MGYKGKFVKGEIPESGAIFMSNVQTKEECFERELFGLPSGMSDFVLNVKNGMTLFLFEFERRLLYGVYRATCDGAINIEPKAFRSSGKHFPAQIRFTTVWDCSPIAEHEFRGVIRDNYHTKNKFHFGLSEKQVDKLMKLFRPNILSKIRPERSILKYEDKPAEGNRPKRSIQRYDDKPAEENRSERRIRRYDDKSAEGNRLERSIRRYDDKPAEGNARSSDLRKDIRHRLGFNSCDSRGDEVKDVDDNMYINKRTIESRQKDVREEFSTHYTTESDEFGRHDLLGKHLDLREKHIEDDYIPVFSKPHGQHLEEIGVGSSDSLMDDVNKDITDYNRLLEEYKVREGFRLSLKEHQLSNHVLSHFNQNAYSSYDHTRIGIPDIQLNPTCFDNGSSFIPITAHSPEKIPMITSLPYYSHNEGSGFIPIRDHSSEEIPMITSRSYYSHNEGSVQYLDDPGSQSSIIPKFISRKLSSSDADLRVHEVDPTDGDNRLCEEHDVYGTPNHRASVFSRLSSTLRHGEQAIETDELNSSVDKVMKMLEKVVSSPIKRTRKGSSVIKQDDDYKSADSKIEDDESLRVNFEADADMAYEEVDVESAFQETRLVDFKRRKQSNKRTDDTSKECSEGLVGSTSEVGPAEQLTVMPNKRRKLVRPAFVENNVIPDGASAHENTLSKKNDSKVDVVIKFVEDVPTVPTSHENTLPENNSKVGDKVIKSMVDVHTVPTSLGNTLSESDSKVDDTATKSVEDVLTVPTFLANIPSENDSKVDDTVIKSVKDVLMVPTSLENTLSANDSKVDDTITKSGEEVLTVPTFLENIPSENDSKVDDTVIKSVEDVLMVPASLENTLSENDSKADDTVIKSVEDVLTVPTSLENTLSENDSISIEADETSEKVDTVIKSMVDVVRTCHENAPDDSNSTKAGNESSKKVDVSIKPIDLNMLPTSDESSLSKDDNPTLDLLESLEKVDVSVEAIDINILPTSDESLPSKDDDNTTKPLLESLHMSSSECQKSGNEGGNAENLLSDVFVEATPVASPKDDQKMCGWIEW